MPAAPPWARLASVSGRVWPLGDVGGNRNCEARRSAFSPCWRRSALRRWKPRTPAASTVLGRHLGLPGITGWRRALYLPLRRQRKGRRAAWRKRHAGQPGWMSLDGPIQPDGTAVLDANGIAGHAAYNINARKRGRPTTIPSPPISMRRADGSMGHRPRLRLRLRPALRPRPSSLHRSRARRRW